MLPAWVATALEQGTKVVIVVVTVTSPVCVIVDVVPMPGTVMVVVGGGVRIEMGGGMTLLLPVPVGPTEPV